MIEIEGKNLQELAEEIVKLPDGYAFSKEKELQAFLTGTAEQRNPLKYAEIFRAAAEHPKASPWMKYACLVEEINGKRRAKGAKVAEIEKELLSTLREIEEKLSSSQAKFELLGGSWYNIGLLQRNQRKYREAAQTQRLSSAWYGFAGNKEKQLERIFVSQVEEVTASFETSDDSLVRKEIEALVSARDLVKSALPTYPGWMDMNASVHIAWAVMMAKLRGVKGIEPKDYAGDFRRALATSMPQWAKVFQVWEDYRKGRYKRVAGAVPVDLPSSSADNAALTVQILVALAERKLRLSSKARERLEAVANHQGPNGGIPIAVAAMSLQ